MNLAKEHTPYELAVLQAYERIEPWGERRADLRMAMQTLALVQVQMTRTMTDEERQEFVRGLISYTERGSDEEQVVSPEEAAKHGRALFASLLNRKAE